MVESAVILKQADGEGLSTLFNVRTPACLVSNKLRIQMQGILKMKMVDRTESRYESMWQGQSRLRHIGDIHYIAYKQITLSYLSVIWRI